MLSLPRLAIIVFLLAATPLHAEWTGFRGDGTGVAAGKAPPAEWNAEKNIAWKADLPGNGVSSPIVVQGRVIVTCASGAKNDKLHVLCFDGASGKKLWERQFWATGRTLCFAPSSIAANSPAAEGDLIYAFFSSNDLVCLDVNGQLRWFRGLAVDYPQAGNDVGMASSVAATNGTVIVQSQSQGDSFVLGIDGQNGATRWRLDREKSANWASPVVLKGKQPEENLVLLSGSKGLSAHEPLTGFERWLNPKECDSISSVVPANGVIYVPGGGLRAVKYSENSVPEVLWSNAKINPGAASPIAHDGKVYAINRSGVLNCADAKTGEKVWDLRLKGEFWASPVVSGNLMFVTGKEGLVQVVDLSKPVKGEVVAENKMEAELYATPAIDNGALFIRSNKTLWKIAAP